MNENHAFEPVEGLMAQLNAAVPEPQREAEHRATFLANVPSVRVTHTRKARPFGLLTAAAAGCALILFGLLTITRYVPSSSLPSAQEATHPLAGIVPITVENAAQIELLTTLGRGAVRAAEYSPDGLTLTVATTTGIYLHNVANLSAEPELLQGSASTVSTIAYSADGELLAGAYSNVIRLWDAQTYESSGQIETDAFEISKLSFSADGQRLIGVGCAEKQGSSLALPCDQLQARVWDTNTENEIRVISLGEGYQSTAISPDGSLLATTDRANFTIALYSLETGEIVKQFTDRDDIYGMNFSPNGDQLAHTTFSQITVWDVDDLLNTNAQELDNVPPTLQRSNFLSGATHGVVISRDGGRLAAANYSGKVKVWGVAADDPLLSIDIGVSQVAVMDFTPDESGLLTITYRGLIQQWDTATGAEISRSEAYGQPANLVQIANNRSFLTEYGLYDGALHLWDLNAEPISRQILDNAKIDLDLRAVRTVGITPDNAHLIYITEFKVGDNRRLPDIWVHYLETGEDRTMGQWRSGSRHLDPRQIFEPENVLMLLDMTWSEGAFVVRKPLLDRQIRTKLVFGKPNSQYISSIAYAFSPDAHLLAGNVCTKEDNSIYANCPDGEVRVWNTQTGRLLTILDLETAEDALDLNTELAFNPDSDILVVNTCTEGNRANALAIASYIPCPKGKVQFYDLSTLETQSNQASGPLVLQPLPTKLEFTDYRINLAISPLSTPDNLLIALAQTRENTTQLWKVDLQAGTTDLMNTIADTGENVTFSPDGTLLATSGEGTIKLWGIR